MCNVWFMFEILISLFLYLFLYFFISLFLYCLLSNPNRTEKENFKTKEGRYKEEVGDSLVSGKNEL